MRKIVPALVIVVALAFGGPAAAATGGPARSKLTLSYLSDAGYAAAIVLRCDPVGGVHPHAAAACRTLARVGGDVARLEAVDAVCTLEYSPITAMVTGSWRGRAVGWSRKFGNICAMNRATGVLFRF